MKIIYNKNGTIDFLATREIALGNPSFDEVAAQIANNKAFLVSFSSLMDELSGASRHPANKTPAP